jgi:hypothetical protein
MPYQNVSIVTNRGAQYRSRARNTTTFGAWQPIGATFAAETYRNQVSVSTPNFRQVKRQQLPEHPYSRHERDTTSNVTIGGVMWGWSDGSSAENQIDGFANSWGLDAFVTAAHDPPDGPIDSKAIGRLLDSLSETKGSLAVSMAEIDKTAAMVAQTATRLVKAYRGLRSGDLGAFADTVGITISRRRIKAYRQRFKQMERRSDTKQFASATWLEYTYGWKPLVSDVYTQAENLARYLTQRQGVIREVRGSAKELKTSIEKQPAVNSDWSKEKIVESLVRISYTVRYKCPDGSPSFVNTFGLNNPLIVAWELLPFSFVADWFIPIGDYLSGLTATSGLLFHSGTRTRHYKVTCRHRATAGPPYPDQGGTRTPYLTIGGLMEQQKRGKTRTVLSDFPRPKLTFKNPLSVSHAISALSLMQAVFHGGESRSWRYIR